MVTKKFEQIREFNQAVDKFMRTKPGNIQTKLGYAMKKMSNSGSFKKAITDYQAAYSEKYYTEVESVQVDNALTDKETKAILLAPKDAERPYLYDKEGLKKVMLAERRWNQTTAPALLKEWDETLVELEPFYVTDVPAELSSDDIEALSGFVIDPSYVAPAPVEAVADAATPVKVNTEVAA